MKINERIRQNKKVYRHSIVRNRIPEPRRRAAKVGGILLISMPEVKAMLKDIRKKYMTRTNDDGYEYELTGDEIDWNKIRVEIEENLRAIPDILPRELENYQQIVENQKTLPRKVRFTEPATKKLKDDVRKLYKGFANLYNFVANNFAVPTKRAIDSFFEAASDNLVEFLKTGIERELPNNWIISVNTLTIFEEKVIVAMVNELADPDEIMELFYEEFSKTYKRSRPIFTKMEVEGAKYFGLYLQKMRIQDIADEYIQDNHIDLIPDSDDYLIKKRRIENMLDHRFRRVMDKISNLFEDKT